MAISNVQYNLGEGTLQYVTDALNDDGPIFRLIGGGLTVGVDKSLTGADTQVGVRLWGQAALIENGFVEVPAPHAMHVSLQPNDTRTFAYMANMPPAYFRFETDAYGDDTNFVATVYIQATPGRLLRVIE